MMGQLPAAQNALFYEFSLEHHIPDDHLLRHIDQLLDFDVIRQHLTPHYCHTGRPSIDPELMIRMLLLGYCYGIRSERRLCEEVNFNLAYRWFCRLDLEDAVPDHSTFSKNRQGRFRDSDLLRYVFNTVVAHCVKEGLVGGEGFAIDASLVRADANIYQRDNEWITIETFAPGVNQRPLLPKAVVARASRHCFRKGANTLRSLAQCQLSLQSDPWPEETNRVTHCFV